MNASNPSLDNIRKQWDNDNECWDVIDQHGEYDSCYDTIEEAHERMDEIKAETIRAELEDVLDDITNHVHLDQILKLAKSFRGL